MVIELSPEQAAAHAIARSFGRAPLGCRRCMMEERASDEGQNPVQPNVQLPVGREVVFLPKTIAAMQTEAGKRNLSGILLEDDAANTANQRTGVPQQPGIYQVQIGTIGNACNVVLKIFPGESVTPLICDAGSQSADRKRHQ